MHPFAITVIKRPASSGYVIITYNGLRFSFIIRKDLGNKLERHFPYLEKKIIISILFFSFRHMAHLRDCCLNFFRPVLTTM
jgi:hypothetical protein